MTSDWLAFWDSRHFLYGNAHHKDVHYRLIAQAIAAQVPSGEARALDYGSGEALHADVVAAAAGEVLLCEPRRACAPGWKSASPATRRFVSLPRTRSRGCRGTRSI